MRNIALLAAVVLISSCATSQEDRMLLRGKTPTAVFKTDKSMGLTYECIDMGLRAVANPEPFGSITVKDSGDSKIITVTQMANPTVVVTLTPDGDGTAVDYRSRFRAGYGSVTNAVLGCR